VAPRSTSAAQMWEPTKPFAPVTTTIGLEIMSPS
jgi:hypothetical protein